MLTAITRAVSPNINQCELTHLARKPIDFKVARTQHQHYEEALQALGYEVKTLPAEAALPDSVFVEDTAIVLDELAIITRPGAASRRPEVESIRQALEPFRSVQTVQAPALLDGGDVLKIGKRLYVGLSTRTNREAVGQLHGIVAPYGYSAHAVEFQGCLHLKSAVTCVGECTLLINPEWVVPDGFDGIDCIAVDPSNPLPPMPCRWVIRCFTLLSTPPPHNGYASKASR